MDNFYREFPFASYKIHQLWVQSILDEEKEQREAERKKEKELVEIDTPRYVISIVGPSKRIDTQPSLIKKQPIGQKKPPSLDLPSDAKKVNLQKPKKKLKYTIDELIRIDMYQRCPFSSYSYHQEWVKGLIEKEQRDKDKKKRSSSKCYKSDLSEMSDVTEELSIGKRKRQRQRRLK